MIVAYNTLQEAHALVLRRLGIARAGTFLREMVGTTVLVVPTEEDHRQAIQRVLRYPDQDISLADAVNAAVSGRLETPVWTYDHHFDVMGVGVWL